MWDQSINQTSQISFITPRKEMQSQNHSDKEQIRQDITMQYLNRPRQIQNKINRCLNFNMGIKEKEILEQ